jgi:hypothetical protein
MSTPTRLAALTLSVALLTACGAQDAPEAPDEPTPRYIDVPAEVSYSEEAGFIELASTPTTFQGNASQSPDARLFYAFQPADQASAKAPLFVFFNGGPGFGTSLGLLANNTSRRTLSPHFIGGLTVGPSPRPWTALGNLLYIDARQTGFSYDHGAQFKSGEGADLAFARGTYNPFADAADTVRVVLRFLESHPQLRSHPVVLVGESYGGLRSNIMLYMIHHPEAVEDASAVYRDPELAAEIRAHFAKTRPGVELSPDLAAAQFGRQILIQPMVGGQDQIDAANRAHGAEGSRISEIATAHGVHCKTCSAADPECDAMQSGLDCVQRVQAKDLDPYDLSQTNAESAASFVALEAALRATGSLQTLLGVDPKTIAGLSAKDRADAFRFVLPIQDAPAPADLTTQEPLAADLGALSPNDRYLVGLSFEVNQASNQCGVPWTLPVWGDVFLLNLEHVETFITDARFDTIVYSPSIADVLSQKGRVMSAVHDETPEEGVARPGKVTVELTTMKENVKQTHVIRMPYYETSGHEVTERQPVELFEDVAAWMAEAP